MNCTQLIPLFAALTFALPAQDDKKPQDKPAEGPKSEAPKDDAGKSAKVDFVAQVLPILEKRCVECHKAPHTGADGKQKKPKGGVTMDSRAAIEKSKKGKLIVASKPDDSLLYHSITLPADDEDRMPPAKKGDPLPQDQLDLIKKWIEEGADFGAWTGADAKSDQKPTEKGANEKPKEPAKGDAKKDQPKKTGEGALAQLGADLAPLPPAAMDALRSRFSVEPAALDSALLRVSSFGREATIDDAAIAALAAAGEHIAELVLARTQVTDASMALVAAMPRLLHLDLRATKVGDAGIKALAAARELRSLNLVGSEVGDAGLAALGSCAKLEAVYLWQTPVSAQAVVDLQHALPTAKIVLTADLPSPMADADAGRNRRR